LSLHDDNQRRRPAGELGPASEGSQAARVGHLPRVAVLTVCLLSGWASGSDGGVAAAVRDLAAAQGFTVSGLDHLGNEAARPEGGDIEHRLRALLSGYNYAAQEDPRGHIRRVVILGRKRSAPSFAPDHTVRALPFGSQRAVEATITGPTGVRLTVPLIVDTGASSVVLPSAMIGALGFRPEDLRQATIQTANGRASARRGTLGAVAVGTAVVQDVAVTFVDDQQLAGHALLGMSFLDRFRLKFDDLDGYLTLTPR
jgi:aspartyl protease family protein